MMKFKSYKLQQREMLRRSEHAPREQQKCTDGINKYPKYITSHQRLYT